MQGSESAPSMGTVMSMPKTEKGRRRPSSRRSSARSKGAGVLAGLAVLGLFLGQAAAQDAPAAAAGLQTGPATVAPHWSKYAYLRSIPEGATYYIIVRDDTLWDLARRFLGNPYLWPQIWDR